jgi:hypothetical protein
MKAVIGSLAILAVLWGSGAEAGIFKKKNPQPKAIDTPYVRPKIDDAHKFGHHGGRHRERPLEWGGKWEQIFAPHPIRVGHYMDF